MSPLRIFKMCQLVTQTLPLCFYFLDISNKMVNLPQNATQCMPPQSYSNPRSTIIMRQIFFPVRPRLFLSRARWEPLTWRVFPLLLSRR